MQFQQSWDLVVGCFGCWWWAIALKLFQRGGINTQQDVLCSSIKILTGKFIDQTC